MKRSSGAYDRESLKRRCLNVARASPSPLGPAAASSWAREIIDAEIASARRPAPMADLDEDDDGAAASAASESAAAAAPRRPTDGAHGADGAGAESDSDSDSDVEMAPEEYEDLARLLEEELQREHAAVYADY